MARPNSPKPPVGRKSKHWSSDPEILRRLSEVEDLVLAGYRNTEIGAHLGLSEATIRRDRKRISSLWKERIGNDLVEMRSRSIANYRRIQRQADYNYRKLLKRGEENGKDAGGQAAAYLRVQIEAEREIARLQGTEEPQQIKITKMADDLSDAELELIVRSGR